LDPLDKKILWELHENCRVSYQTLSDMLGISANAVKKRVSKLIETGVIHSFTALLSFERMNSEALFGLVYTDGYEKETQFIQKLGNNRMIHVVGTIASGSGGAYNFTAQYIGAQGLAELGRYIRTLDHVTGTDLFPLLMPKDHTLSKSYADHKKKLSIDFSNTELKVLRWLIDDPRMSISDVANNTSLTARRVRRTIQQLMDKGIMFSVRWNLSAGGYDLISIRTRIDEKKKSISEVIEWVRSKFPQEFWVNYISADEPLVFFNFVVLNMRVAERIGRTIKEADFVESTIISVQFSETKFPWLSNLKIRDMIKEAGLY
jgi:DNA-binding Lrp family transcriptional regulator